MVGLSETLKRPLNTLKVSDLKKIDKRFNRDCLKVFDVQRAMERRQTAGSPGVKAVRRELADWKKRLKP